MLLVGVSMVDKLLNLSVQGGADWLKSALEQMP